MTRKYIYCLFMFVALACHNLCAQTAFDIQKMGVKLSSDDNTEDAKLLGKNKYGVQLWCSTIKLDAIKEPNVYLNGSDQKLEWCQPGTSGHEGLDGRSDTQYTDAATQHGKIGSGLMHIFMPAGETHVQYGVYNITSQTWMYNTPGGEFSLAPKTTLTASKPVFDEYDGIYKQTLKWNVENVTDNALSQMAIVCSYDGGKQWTVMTTIANDVKACDSINIPIPRQLDQIRYYVVFAPKDEFQLLFENTSDLTSNQTENFKLTPQNVYCDLSISGVGANCKYAEKIYDRKCPVTAKWEIPSSYANAVDSVELQYSLFDNDDEWFSLLKTDQISGSQKVNIPVGDYLYKFRMVIKAKEGMRQLCDTTITNPKTSRVSYFSGGNSPYVSLRIKEKLSECYDSEKAILKPTFAYELSYDLYWLHVGKASISYSTDGGSTWTYAATVDSLKKTGEVQLSIPAEDKDYIFRMNMAYCVNNVITPNISQNTQACTFKKPSITLKDSKAYTAQTLTSGNVTVTRSFVSGRMGTVCLPFALTAAQIAEGFGEKAEVYEYTELKENAMNFTKVTEMAAGKAYLVKTAEDKSSISFTGVNISEDATPKKSDINDNYVFTGTFSPYTMKTDQTEFFLATNGKLKYPSSSSDNANLLGGYRGYFQLSKGSNAKICFDGEITGIDNISVDDNESVKVYNLNGQFVGDNLESLPKGVYVANGKKVIIK